MIALVHPGWNSNVCEVARALEECGLLNRLYTSISGGWGLNRWRQYPVDVRRVSCHPWREALRLGGGRLGLSAGRSHESGIFSVDRVWRGVDAWASLRLSEKVRLIYAYEDGACQVFEVGSRCGMTRVYDLPIGYWREAQKIYREELVECPEFAPLLEGSKDSAQKLERKERELFLADRVHASSNFVRETLVRHGYPENRIRVTTFGAPQTTVSADRNYWDSHGPLKVLFVGRIDQRKGVGYLLHAMERFQRRHVEFHFVGVKPSQYGPIKKYWNRVDDHGVMSRDAVWGLMRQCDLLVLPTLFEGQALVVMEAMACGLPVVITPNAGYQGIVTSGVEGVEIPIRSSQAIVEAIQMILDSPDKLSEMGENARRTAAKWTWSRYRNQVVESLTELLK